MKPIKVWKRHLASINFPDFNKCDDEEIMKFLFTDCKQRDALLTWILMQLGAKCAMNRVLEHSVIIDYLKLRKVVDEGKANDFVNANLSEQDQEHQWDKIFKYIEMHKRLYPRHHLPRHLELSDEIENINLKKDFSRPSFLEPLYKELQSLKELQKHEGSDIDGVWSTRELEDVTEEPSENYIANSDPGNSENSAVKLEEFRKYNKKNKFAANMNISETGGLTSSQTISGTWYRTPDGYNSVFVPVGAPPLGELEFDLKKIKIVCEEDKMSEEMSEDQVKLLEKMKEIFHSKRFA